MKRNLVKILALTAIALSLGACNKNGNSSQSGSDTGPSSTEPAGPTELTMLEVFDLDAGNFRHEGEEIILKQICVYGNYGNTYVVGVPYVEGGSITDLKGIEVELSEAPDWKGETSGRYANVDVTGTLANVNGRPVLQNASLKINAEAQYDQTTGDRIDEDGAYSAGYWPKTVFVRENYDELLGRNMNGTLFEAIFQFASVPGTITAEQGASFYVAFPGENLSLEDEDNDSLLYVEIPAGLNEASITKANTFFADAKAGDFVDMMGITRWDTSKGGMGVLYENYWGRQIKAPASSDVPAIYDSWAKLALDANELYEEPIVDLAAADAEDPLAAPFSFVLDSSKYYDDPKSLWSDAYKDRLVTVTNPDECGTIKVSVNFKPANQAAYFNAVKTKIAALGYETTDDSWSTDGFIVYSLKNIQQKVTATVLLMGTSDASYLTIYYTAKRLITDADFTTFAGAKAAYEERVNLLFAALSMSDTFASALPALADASFSNFNVDWIYEAAYMQYYSRFGLISQFELTASPLEGATQEQVVALANAYVTALGTAGFVQKQFSLFEENGFYNATSREFVMLGLTKTLDLAITVFVLDATSAAFVIDVPAE